MGIFVFTLQFTKVIIARLEDLDRIRGWVGTTIMTGVKIDDAIKPINKSSVGRAIYSGLDSSWHPMERLENYSGYDRDKRLYMPTAATGTTATIERDILKYFEGCTRSPKSMRDFKTSRTLREYQAEDIQKGLDNLQSSGVVACGENGYLLQEWLN